MEIQSCDKDESLHLMNIGKSEHAIKKLELTISNIPDDYETLDL